MSAVEQAAAAPTISLEIEPERLAVKVVMVLPAGATNATVWRTATRTGNVAYVRGWVGFPVGTTDVAAFDWEAPLGVELIYSATATVAGVESDTGTSAPLTIEDAHDWLVDIARPTNTIPVDVEAFPELRYDGPVGVHRVLDRRDPVLTTAAFWTPGGVLTFITPTELDREKARSILGSGVPFLLRTHPRVGVGNMYLGVLDFREQRLSRLGLHPDRRFAADVEQVARPDPETFVPVAPMSYRERLETFPIYDDVVDTGKTYQDIAYTFPAGDVDPSQPWLPTDV